MALILHQRLREADYVGGIFLDQSGEGNNGTPANAPIFTSDQQRNPDRAMVFNGTTDLVTITPVNLATTLTYSMWVNLSPRIADHRNLFAFNRTLINVMLNGSVAWFPDIDIAVVYSSGFLTDGNWHHIGITQTGTTYTIYGDGVSKGTGTTSAIDNTATYKQIGAYGATINLACSIDDVRIYNHALTPIEFTTIYDEEKDYYHTIDENLVGHWTLAEDNYSGGVFQDLTANNNDGTPANAPIFTSDQQRNPDRAMVFNGTTDLVTITPVNLATTLTYSMWVNLSPRIADHRNLFAFNRTLINVMLNGSVAWFPDIDIAVVYSSGFLTDGNWHHIGITQTGTTYTIYGDGVSKGTGTTSAIDNTATYKQIGAYGATINLACSIDDVRIYNHALTPIEFTTIYDEEKDYYHTIDENLVGHWTLAEDNYSGGVFQDLTANNNDGTPANTPVFTTNQQARDDRALVLNGTTDRVNCDSNAILNPTTAISVCAWIKLAELTSDKPILSRYNGATNRAYILYHRATDDSIRFAISHNGTAIVEGITVLPSTDWHHVVGVFDGTNITLYVDGVVGTPVSSPGTIFSSTGNTYIGWGDNFNHYCNGSVDDVRVYNMARNTAEIAHIYNAELFWNPITINSEMDFGGSLAGRNPTWLTLDDTLIWKGEWSATYSYEIDDTVLYKFGDEWHVFVSKIGHNVGNIPTTSPTAWRRLYQEPYL